MDVKTLRIINMGYVMKVEMKGRGGFVYVLGVGIEKVD